MRQFRLVVRHLAYVVQESGTARFLRVQAQLRRHYGTEVGRLAAVLQKVLAVGGTVFHAPNHADELRVQTVDAEVDGGALARLDDFFLHLAAHFGHYLLDAGRVYAAVHHQLVERQARYLAAHRVEAAQDDGLRGVVHYDFDTGGGLKGTDVASLAAYDFTLYLVVVYVEDRHGVLYRRLGGHTLYGLYHDTLGLLAGRHLGVVHYVVDIAGGCRLGLVLERLHEFLLGIFGRQAGDMLQFLAGLARHVLKLGVAAVKLRLFAVEAPLQLVELVLAALEVALQVAQLLLLLFVAGFGALHALHLLAGLALRLVEHLHALLAGFETPFFADYVGFALRVFQFTFRFRQHQVGCRFRIFLRDLSRHQVACHYPDNKSQYNPYRCHYS